MKGKSSAINSLPENLGIRRGSVSSTAVMSQENAPVSNVHGTPVENQLSKYMISSGETTCAHSASHCAQSFDSWTSGEPSSRLTMQNDIGNERLKMEHVCSPLNTGSGNSLRIEERPVGASDSIFCGRNDAGSSNFQNRDRPWSLQGSTSNITYHNERLDAEYVGNSNRGRLGVGSGCSNPYKSSQSETGQPSSVSFCHNPFVNADNMVIDNDGGPGSSGTWGVSCKRKSLEGTSRQFYPGGSSSSFPQPEHGMLRTGTSCFGPSSSLSLSPPPQAPRSADLLEQQSSSINASGMRTISDVFPSSSVASNLERPLRDWRTSQDYAAFSISSDGSARHPSPAPFRDSMERSSAILALNSGGPQGRSHGNEVLGISRGTRSFNWDGGSTSIGGSFSSSFLSGHRNRLQEDLNLGSSSRNHAEHQILLPTETRHDPASWSLATGCVSDSFCSPATSQISPSSSIRSLPNPAFIPPNPPSENQGRLLEFTPWSLFPSNDVESGVYRGHFYPSPSAPTSSRNSALSSGHNSHRHHQSHRRSSFFPERPSDDILGTPHSLRTLAADIEGRRQLISEIRQVLTSIRRAENLAAEDYTMFDPFIYHGMAEIHDRHRDMRLDVDNMSYEELLALEDHIGDVSTGLGEDVILKILKQQKYESLKTPIPQDLEPCCICKEEYADADIIGTLDCGHNFHSKCIKQWLVLKNLCPICKTTALLT